MYRHKFTAGALVVATGLFYLFLTGFQQSSSTHMTLQSLTEAAQKDGLEGERIQLGGEVSDVPVVVDQRVDLALQRVGDVDAGRRGAGVAEFEAFEGFKLHGDLFACVY